MAKEWAKNEDNTFSPKIVDQRVKVTKELLEDNQKVIKEVLKLTDSDLQFIFDFIRRPAIVNGATFRTELEGRDIEIDEDVADIDALEK